MTTLQYYTCQYIGSMEEISILKEKLVTMTSAERVRVLECKYTTVVPPLLHQCLS